jgi:hypothetical protein
MIIVKLNGGLGNQLFQYAAARTLSILHQAALKLDTTIFGEHKLRQYELSPFLIQEAFATPEEIARLRRARRNRVARLAGNLVQGLTPYYRRPVFAEAHLGPYDANILKTPRDVYLDGYWQSEKYFARCANILRKELRVRFEQDPQSREVAARILHTQSVSIHVRRADYVANAATYQTHGTCSRDYYNQCVSLIAKRVNDPHFFVFGDDFAWAKENLQFNHPTTFVSHNAAARDFEDLRLMSMCRHNITANSSFSWWGAWLNSNPDKIVLAPLRWLNDPRYDTRDLLPESWIRV